MTDAVEHWWCPACGTFDGPHHEEFCDVCADGTCIDGLVPRAEVERLRGALEGIKARCDRIVAGEFGGLQAATEVANEARRALASNMGATDPPRPMHGDVWRSRVACRDFSVMHVCGHHDPPHVTGYWWGDDAAGPDPGMHDSIPLPRFTSSMDLLEREDFDA